MTGSSFSLSAPFDNKNAVWPPFIRKTITSPRNRHFCGQLVGQVPRRSALSRCTQHPRGRFLWAGQGVEQLRHAVGQVAAGELRDVRIVHGEAPLQMVLPAQVDESRYRPPVFPVQDESRLSRVEDHRHCSVRLSDAQYRPPGCQVFKKLSREHRLVFRFLSQRQDQQ